MNSSIARLLVVVSLGSMLNINADISAQSSSLAGSFLTWMRGATPAPVQNASAIGSLWLAAKALTPFGSCLAVGSGVALGWKARNFCGDKKTLIRYASIFGSGIAAGVILSKYPWLAVDCIKAMTPVIAPLAIGCYLTNCATSWIS